MNFHDVIDAVFRTLRVVRKLKNEKRQFAKLGAKKNRQQQKLGPKRQKIREFFY